MPEESDIGTEEEVQTALDYLRTQEWFNENQALDGSEKSYSYMNLLANRMGYQTEWHSILNANDWMVAFKSNSLRRGSGFKTKHFATKQDAYIAGLAEAAKRKEAGEAK